MQLIEQKNKLTNATTCQTCDPIYFGDRRKESWTDRMDQSTNKNLQAIHQ